MSKPPAPAKKTAVKKPPAKRSPARQAATAGATRRARAPKVVDEIQPTDPYVEALAARPQHGSFDPEELPQPIVDWQPVHSRDDAPRIGPPRALSAGAAGALAFGALGLLGLALGAVAVGRLAVGRARVGRMEIDHLVVGRISPMIRRR